MEKLKQMNHLGVLSIASSNEAFIFCAFINILAFLAVLCHISVCFPTSLDPVRDFKSKKQ
ncbi:MAG: hypothetical protein PHP62_01525 [Candidatus Moranbacteria bacterium]|nr:hypothetical protein [Candidatus Moranbacteria bacterium]